jgi:hypothetical protein
MVNDFPYLYCVGPVCGASRVVVLCAMCFDELMSRGNVNIMSVCMRMCVGGCIGVSPSIVWLCRITYHYDCFVSFLLIY